MTTAPLIDQRDGSVTNPVSVLANEQSFRNEFFKVFPRATDQDWASWKTLQSQVERLKTAAESLPSETREQVFDSLDRALSFLRFQDGYTLLLVGSSRVGKSSLINAMHARDIVVTGPRVSITGTVIKVSPLPQVQDQEKAVVFYRSWDSLAALVKDLGIEPVYKATQEAELQIHFGKTIDQLKDKQAEVATTQQVPSAFALDDYAQAIEDVIDVLKTFEQRQDRVGMREEIKLDEAGLKQLREICNEQSALNRQEATKVTPLIDWVDCYVHLLHSNLSPAVLIDPPGANALKYRHARRLREQLQSKRTRAFVLVTRQDSITVGIEKLLPQIRETLIGDLNNSAAQLDALKRFVIVVNMADSNEAHIGGASAGEEGLKEVCGLIHPEFYDRYSKTNILRETKAQAGLIAQLMQQHPEEGNRWLHDKHKSDEALAAQYPIFGSFRPEYYMNAISQAKPLPEEDRDQAVLNWSQVPELCEKLNEFLGDNRFLQDFGEAKRYYNQAISVLDHRLIAELKTICEESLSDEVSKDPIPWINQRLSNHDKQDRDELSAISGRLTEAFQSVCQHVEVHSKELKRVISEELTQILDDANQIVDRTLSSEEFLEKNFGIDTDPDADQGYRQSVQRDTLMQLRNHIHDELEKNSLRIAKVVWAEYQTILQTCQIDQHIRAAEFAQDYAVGIGQQMKAVIYDAFRKDYQTICDVAMQTRMLSQPDVVRAISTEIEIGTEKPITDLDVEIQDESPVVQASIQERLDQIRDCFTISHRGIHTLLKDPLYLMFHRRLLKIQPQIAALAQDLVSLHLTHLNQNSSLREALREQRSGVESDLSAWQTRWQAYDSFRES